MCGIQNVTLKHGRYYYRKLIRLGDDKPFRLRISLKTTIRRRAALLAPALTLICGRVAMNIMADVARDGLTGAERAEIFRRQMLIERDRLAAMHADLHILPPEGYAHSGHALTHRLGASELAARARRSPRARSKISSSDIAMPMTRIARSSFRLGPILPRP